MFTCYLHGWHSLNTMCPICQQSQTVTWSSNRAVFPNSDPNVEIIKDTKIEEMRKELGNYSFALFIAKNAITWAKKDIKDSGFNIPAHNTSHSLIDELGCVLKRIESIFEKEKESGE